MWDKLWLILAVIVFTYLSKKIKTSEEPSKFFFYLKFSIFYLYGSLLACIVWPFFLFTPKNLKNAALGAWLIKPVTKIYDLKWHLRNGEVLSKEEGAVIVSNHQSSLDILGLFNIWNDVGKLAPIAKKELFYVWPFGLAAYLAGVVFIDRKNARGAYEQLKITSDVMVKNKTKMWLFPEGTRNKENDTLLPFKKGAFIIAVAAQKPIIPVVFSPYYFINEKKYIFNKGHVVIQCLEPVPTEGLTMEDVPDLVDRVRNQMDKKYKELIQEVLSALPPDYPHAYKDHKIAGD
ncbi:1-acyl-sn-glycerol-3-phosphate acyltransferase beta-like [Vanessa atalanta]|uniref:1-acyl-sn-glycerol-3-phosphate acyltransferase beta-like n=1 Tax=Vanessa atalanta TaxID=42275 RepID=UPI001FCD3FDA|nr:1-acyl-sn-glycerol-3-phosphate acyltransferase beta-like [Vanessa atalanta]